MAANQILLYHSVYSAHPERETVAFGMLAQQTKCKFCPPCMAHLRAPRTVTHAPSRRSTLEMRPTSTEWGRNICKAVGWTRYKSKGPSRTKSGSKGPWVMGASQLRSTSSQSGLVTTAPACKHVGDYYLNPNAVNLGCATI